MNLFVGILTSSANGILYAFAGESRMEPDEFAGRWFLALIVYHSIVFTPLLLLSVVFHPDWSVMYLFRPVQLFSVAENDWMFSAVVVASSFCAAIGGYAGARSLILNRHRRDIALVAMYAAYVLPVVMAAVFYRRFLLVGDMDQWKAGAARQLFARSPGYLLVACAVSIPGGVMFWSWMFARKPSHM